MQAGSRDFDCSCCCGMVVVLFPPFMGSVGLPPKFWRLRVVPSLHFSPRQYNYLDSSFYCVHVFMRPRPAERLRNFMYYGLVHRGVHPPAGFAVQIWYSWLAFCSRYARLYGGRGALIDSYLRSTILSLDYSSSNTFSLRLPVQTRHCFTLLFLALTSAPCLRSSSTAAGWPA